MVAGFYADLAGSGYRLAGHGYALQDGNSRFSGRQHSGRGTESGGLSGVDAQAVRIRYTGYPRNNRMTGFYPRGIALHEKMQRLVIEAVQWLRDSTVAVIVARYQTDFESPATSLRRLRF